MVFTRRMMSCIGFGVGLSQEKGAGGLGHIGGGIHAHCGAQSERAASVGLETVANLVYYSQLWMVSRRISLTAWGRLYGAGKLPPELQIVA